LALLVLVLRLGEFVVGVGIVFGGAVAAARSAALA
jgi:hypothetical protein